MNQKTIPIRSPKNCNDLSLSILHRVCAKKSLDLRNIILRWNDIIPNPEMAKYLIPKNIFYKRKDFGILYIRALSPSVATQLQYSQKFILQNIEFVLGQDVIKSIVIIQ